MTVTNTQTGLEWTDLTSDTGTYTVTNLPVGTRFELRADVFNVFNRLNPNNPNVTVTAAEFGRISTAKIPRQTQLSFRLEF